MTEFFSSTSTQEQSSLTGEPDAVSATVTAQHDVPIESRNLVFSSSLVMNGGSAVACVGVAAVSQHTNRHAS